MFAKNGTSDFFLIRWTINQQAGKCLLHQCLPMPASACQNLYIVRWTRIYIRLLLLFKNPPSPSFSTFEGFLFIHKLYSSSRVRELPVSSIVYTVPVRNNYYLKTFPLPLLVLLKDFYIHNDTVTVSFDSTKYSVCTHTRNTSMYHLILNLVVLI